MSALPTRVAVFGGKNGLLGRSVCAALSAAGVEALPLATAEVNPLDAASLAAFLDEAKPDCLVNTLAHTQVDKAEDEVEASYRLNEALPAALGAQAKARGLRLLHYSTDFVFDGSAGTPRTPEDPVNPLSVYGASKLAGERALLALDLPGLLILRTSWLFGPGKMNFVRRMVELAAERPELNVVADQFGSPTYTPDLAALSVALLRAGATGLLHAANNGPATWFELAAEAVRVSGRPCKVNPIPTSAYPTKAVRPPYSVMDISRTEELAGLRMPHWREAVAVYVPGLLSGALA